jgi:hypothetical protein
LIFDFLEGKVIYAGNDVELIRAATGIALAPLTNVAPFPK